MNLNGLDQRLIAQWNQAAIDLGIMVTAPVELRDASGQPFTCEAFVHDFGSPKGAVVLSPKTARRVRSRITDEIWWSGSERRLAGYKRSSFINELLDWGWFGEAGSEPTWYAERMPA